MLGPPERCCFCRPRDEDVQRRGAIDDGHVAKADVGQVVVDGLRRRYAGRHLLLPLQPSAGLPRSGQKDPRRAQELLHDHEEGAHRTIVVDGPTASEVAGRCLPLMPV